MVLTVNVPVEAGNKAVADGSMVSSCGARGGEGQIINVGPVYCICFLQGKVFAAFCEKAHPEVGYKCETR